MEVSQTIRLGVTDASGIGHARRAASELAARAGFDEVGVGRLAVIVTEAASNLLKHAGSGEILLQSLRLADDCGMEVLALDRGGGIADLARATRDGFSTTGTAGTGFGAIARLSALVDVYSRPNEGVVLLARMWAHPPKPLAGHVLAGGVNVSHPDEQISGDVWTADVAHARTRLLVADGLGHGPGAAEAAHAAAAIFWERGGYAPAELLERMHAALAATRGAAVAVAIVDHDARAVRYAGVGNISASIVDGGVSRSLVSHHGTLGHDARRFQEFTYPWPEGAVLVMHSDGIGSRWRLESSPGLAVHDPTLIAATLYRDHQRGRDDATVAVLRDTS